MLFSWLRGGERRGELDLLPAGLNRTPPRPCPIVASSACACWSSRSAVAGGQRRRLAITTRRGGRRRCARKPPRAARAPAPSSAASRTDSGGGSDSRPAGSARSTTWADLLHSGAGGSCREHGDRLRCRACTTPSSTCSPDPPAWAARDRDGWSVLLVGRRCRLRHDSCRQTLARPGLLRPGRASTTTASPGRC